MVPMQNCTQEQHTHAAAAAAVRPPVSPALSARGPDPSFSRISPKLNEPPGYPPLLKQRTMSCGSARTPTTRSRTSQPSRIAVVASTDTKASPLTLLYSNSSGISCGVACDVMCDVC
jgi:hypothetical protein